MVNDDIGHNARLLIMNKKVKKVGDTIWEVGDEIVRKIIRPGRSFFTCTCKSYVMFCSQNPRCYHKEAVIILNEKFHEKIDKLIKFYENAKGIKFDIDPCVIVNDLNDLKYFK